MLETDFASEPKYDDSPTNRCHETPVRANRLADLSVFDNDGICWRALLNRMEDGPKLKT